jgi:hypothetical protein
MVVATLTWVVQAPTMILRLNAEPRLGSRIMLSVGARIYELLFRVVWWRRSLDQFHGVWMASPVAGV